MKVFLASSNVAPGHCVIINDCDQPCGELVAVVTAVGVGKVSAKYLCKRIAMKDCSSSRQEFVTPVSDFGVSVEYENGVYRCVKTGESVAKYPDGKPRQWQESCPLEYKPKIAVLEKVEAINHPDANLMAAAPDLLEALQTTATWLEWWLLNQECDCESDHICGKKQRQAELDQARVAIAKATGDNQ